MSDGYYPKYYLRKRQRDKLFRSIWTIISWVLGCCLAIIVGFVLWKQFPPSRFKQQNTLGLAEQKEQLEAQERVADSRSNTNDQASAGEQPADFNLEFEGKLEDLEYSESMPDIRVAVNEGASQPASEDPHTVSEPEVVDPNQADDTSPQDNSEEVAIETPAPPAQDDDQASPVVEPQEAKPDPPEEKQPVKEPVQETVDTARKVKVFVIYAGYFRTRDVAASRKKDLNVLGFPGTIKENGGEFTILVTQVESSEEAVVLEKRLEENGFPNAFITRTMK